jgi:hypothetical protein
VVARSGSQQDPPDKTRNFRLRWRLGADVIAFNRGDGQDVINASKGKDNTLSLGGGITYSNLSFVKSANDLILVTGASDQITLKA